MSDETVPFPEIDTTKNQLICCFGRKGSGKSVAAETLYKLWPGVDRLCLDVNADCAPGDDARRVTTGELPGKMPPRGDDGRPVNVHYVPDPTSASYWEDLDKAMRMALFPQDRRTLTWVDEVGRLTPPGKTGPYTRTFLEQGRHFNASGIVCGPRPKDIAPLWLQQADRVLCYDLPNPADRLRVAQTIGWDPADFDEVMREVRQLNATVGPHHFAQYVAAEHEMFLCPPLPPEWTGRAA